MNLNTQVVLYGPPGYFWKIQNISEIISDLRLHFDKMRLCYFGYKYDKNGPPSATAMKFATNMKYTKRQWNCPCRLPHDKHIKDWYGHTDNKAEWRRNISIKVITALTHVLMGDQCKVNRPTTVLQVTGNMIPPTEEESDEENEEPTADTTIKDACHSPIPIDPPTSISKTTSSLLKHASSRKRNSKNTKRKA